MCRRSPHTFTEEVLKDLPSKDLSGGALFWDLKEDSNNEGEYIPCKNKNIKFFNFIFRALQDTFGNFNIE